jgi:thioredoxin 1
MDFDIQLFFHQMVQFVKSQQEFNTILAANQLVIVDFTASWCGPCKMIAPIFEQFAAENPSIKFTKVDVDEQSTISQAEGITAMPTFIAYLNGKRFKDLRGADKNGLEDLVKQLSTQKVYTEQELKGMSIKELKVVMRAKMVSMEGVVEKQDIIAKILATSK